MSATEEVAKLEQQLDTVEDLVEAGREMLRRKASLRDQEKLAKELAGETRTLLAQLEGEEVPERSQPLLRSKDLDYRKLSNSRKAKGMTQAVLAERVGISPAYLSQLENGRQTPSSALRDRLFAVLGLKLGS